jgi:hypothetical protein
MVLPFDHVQRGDRSTSGPVSADRDGTRNSRFLTVQSADRPRGAQVPEGRF